MRLILSDVWRLDLRSVEIEFTNVNPAQDRFADLARELRQEAGEQAHRHGRELCVATASMLAA